MSVPSRGFLTLVPRAARSASAAFRAARWFAERSASAASAAVDVVIVRTRRTEPGETVRVTRLGETPAVAAKLVMMDYGGPSLP